TITLGALGLAGAAVASLSGVLADRAAAVEGPPAEAPTGVETLSVTRVDSYIVERRFVGEVEPARATGLAFELPGVVDEIRVEEGELIPVGAIVAAIDTALLEADRERLAAAIEALEAEAELVRRTLERREELNARGFASEQALDEIVLSGASLRARIAEAQAALRGVEVQMEKSTLRAPFAGRVAERFLDDGAVAAAGQAVVRLLEETKPQMRVSLAPDLAAELRAGDPLNVRIGEQDFQAEVVRLLPDLDLRTRMRPVLVELDVTADAATGLYGRTGTVTLASDVSERGAWLPLTAVREGARGTWTILTLTEIVDGLGTVALEAVEVIHTDGARVFVRGTFEEGAAVIASGGHRVVPGQRAVDMAHPAADDLLLTAAQGS
ncbi:MAG: efflux RND transporter periplasmic adaptor subunit, partial [Pseudomonadota bacterium]